MIYRIYKENIKTGKRVKHNDFPTLEQAEKSAEKLRGKNRRRKVEVVQVPEHIGVGYEIFRPNGELYGTIVEETEHFYYIDAPWKKVETSLDRIFFLKETFLEHFEKGHFKAVDGDPNKIKKYEGKSNKYDDMFEGEIEEDDDE